MKPLKASMQTSAASKIKQKLLSECVRPLLAVGRRHICAARLTPTDSLTETRSVVFVMAPDTSSFFKVSLKTNNKALAMALAAQRQRSTELEKDVVYLQKQVEALCFELAARKHKERKLVRLLLTTVIRSRTHSYKSC